MSVAALQAPAADSEFITEDLEPYMNEFFEREAATWQELEAGTVDLLRCIDEFRGGGKYLRPRFCYWGAAISGLPPAAALPAAAAVEFLHVFALVHDDLMDRSGVRRGRAALHVQLSSQHRGAGWAGDCDEYGNALALLAGDLAFSWANRLAGELPRSAAGLWHQMVHELTVGQYLDLVGSAQRRRGTESATTVAMLKSARYTVTGPLLLGMSLGGRPMDRTVPRTVAEPMGAFGDRVGLAFQLQDDLAGVFGDPLRIGKPVGEDLRSGKPTLLLATALQRCDETGRALLSRAGEPDLDSAELAAMTELLASCGARDEVAGRIRTLRAEAFDVLYGTGLPEPVRTGLIGLTDAALAPSASAGGR